MSRKLGGIGEDAMRVWRHGIPGELGHYRSAVDETWGAQSRVASRPEWVRAGLTDE